MNDGSGGGAAAASWPGMNGTTGNTPAASPPGGGTGNVTPQGTRRGASGLGLTPPAKRSILRSAEAQMPTVLSTMSSQELTSHVIQIREQMNLDNPWLISFGEAIGQHADRLDAMANLYNQLRSEMQVEMVGVRTGVQQDLQAGGATALSDLQKVAAEALATFESHKATQIAQGADMREIADRADVALKAMHDTLAKADLQSVESRVVSIHAAVVKMQTWAEKVEAKLAQGGAAPAPSASAADQSGQTGPFGTTGADPLFTADAAGRPGLWGASHAARTAAASGAPAATGTPRHGQGVMPETHGIFTPPGTQPGGGGPRAPVDAKWIFDEKTAVMPQLQLGANQDPHTWRVATRNYLI